MCREAWIVTMADKWCSLMETFHVHKGHGALIEKLQKIEEGQEKLKGGNLNQENNGIG